MTPWTAARQACLSITDSHSLLKLMSTEMWDSELEGGKWSWGEDEMGQQLIRAKKGSTPLEAQEQQGKKSLKKKKRKALEREQGSARHVSSLHERGGSLWGKLRGH